jgi:deazaflavin-dependent oxidoreductase (nitroreductase family)
MNSFVNPLVRWLLRSPLHSMLSGSLMLITVHGRKSGKSYTLPVQYAQTPEAIYVIPGDAEHKTWWRNLRGGAPVTVLLRGKELSAQAEIMPSAETAIALQPYLQRFPAAARMRNIRRMPDGTFNRADLQAVAPQVVMVRITLK